MSLSQWVSSIKTRIKTSERHRSWKRHRLNEYLPLKQGLRLQDKAAFSSVCWTQWVSSIKTRIKTLFGAVGIVNGINTQWVSSIKTRIKTLDRAVEGLSFYSQWVSSIKTRIKTARNLARAGTPYLNEYLPLKQGLRHLPIQSYTLPPMGSMSIFH